MTSRERIDCVLNHRLPDRVPLDLGGSGVTGMHVSTVYRLRQHLGLDPPGTPVRVIEPYQMLGEIRPDLMQAVGADVVEVCGRSTLFGFEKTGWKPWTLFDGTPVLVPAGFNTVPSENGEILMYPNGDPTAPASGKMPKDGYYFDTIIRQQPIENDTPDLEGNLEEFQLLSQEDIDDFTRQVETLYSDTDKAIFAALPLTGFGDIALVPAPWLRQPRGIRDIEEWYISLKARPEYIKNIFSRQCDVALANLERLAEKTADKISIVFVSGTDFGLQTGPFMSVQSYRELFKPFQNRINSWIHENTHWKTFMHSCGAIRPLIPEMIEAGFDILNPVQTGAADMSAAGLADQFGGKIVFWGGGVDTQKTLPFGSPDQVRQEVRERLRIFGKNGNFVFNTIHNIQPGVPIENLMAMYETVREFGGYPLNA